LSASSCGLNVKFVLKHFYVLKTSLRPFFPSTITVLPLVRPASPVTTFANFNFPPTVGVEVTRMLEGAGSGGSQIQSLSKLLLESPYSEITLRQVDRA